MMRIPALSGMACCLSLLMGCEGENRETARPDDRAYQINIDQLLLDEGRIAYAQYCVGCHGEDGNGEGEGAEFLHPRPRNFQLANYKFSSARAGQLPTDADLKRTIVYGLRGSGMPPFRLLPERTVDGLIAYIKTFSDKWTERGPGISIPIVPDPYATMDDKQAAIDRGAALYHGLMGCWNCHPAYESPEKMNEHLVLFDNPTREAFRENLDQAVPKPSSEGHIVYPPDFYRDYVRSGPSVSDLYRSIGAGITGSAMPTWIDSIDIPGDGPDDPPLSDKTDIWAIAYYVQYLIEQRPPRLMGDQIVVRDRPIPVGDPVLMEVVDDSGAEEEESFEGDEGEEDFDN